MAFVQAVKASTTGATSIVTVATDFSGCNWIGIVASVPAARTVTFTDSSSNTWAAIGTSPQTIVAATKLYAVFKENPIVSAVQTFTATISASDIGFMAVIGLSGRATATSTESTNYAADASDVTTHVGGATGGQTATDDLIAFLADNETIIHGRNNPYTPSGSWIANASLNNGDGRTTMTGGIFYQANVSAGSVTAGWTTASANTGAAFVVAVKAAGSNVPVLTSDYFRRRRLM
jgi:hypothetical protein